MDYIIGNKYVNEAGDIVELKKIENNELHFHIENANIDYQTNMNGQWQDMTSNIWNIVMEANAVEPKEEKFEEITSIHVDESPTIEEDEPKTGAYGESPVEAGLADIAGVNEEPSLDKVAALRDVRIKDDLDKTIDNTKKICELLNELSINNIDQALSFINTRYGTSYRIDLGM